MKFSIIGLLVLFFFLGYVLNTPTDNQLRVDPEKLEQFENEIIIEDNEYSNYSNIIESGKVNIPVGKHIGCRKEDEYIINYLEDGEYVAELTIGESVTKYVNIQDAVYNIPTDGTL